MLKQLLCWLKTGHKNRRQSGLFYKKKPYKYYPDGLVCASHVTVYKKYECNECGYKGKEFFEHYSEMPF
jgi:hypothetical protein